MKEEIGLWELITPYLKTNLTAYEKMLLAGVLDMYCYHLEIRGIRNRTCVLDLIASYKGGKNDKSV